MILRTRFAKDIICEFLPPGRPSNKVIIFAMGMPSAPRMKELLQFWAAQGYWVFLPRYRGSWESGGRFLKDSPEKDILDVLNALSKPFKDFWYSKTFIVKPQRIYIFGSSFGGPAAILASRDARVSKVVGISPVVDWRVPLRAEPLGFLGLFIRLGFGLVYRFSMKDWNKLKAGKFYNPVNHLKELDPKKIFLIHAKDDESVSYKSVIAFSKKLGCKLKTYKRGGHLGISFTTRPTLAREIERFLRN
ncbi:MAG: hypothetical protein A3J48_01565 [Candidatus Doudnabacteria bacterium RIFCSPHIGHO2_02_FULL_46_11]|uniref:Peptidase S9 prolyl oligopeptidase catalytic domain-containing protein n=1 Tax=Candidatus Doudnabacteria bacterium RIFCSPHIGHO2_02_FULL_46_11 TaxID=1817832 RepID=A0A1F5P9H0_9BACT|nr:MAG: hypothetical protein A3J48_01565 [Candidatus Doudnabacteria bacterium RIFCSPHIGHO2_02_FULL_46_11]